MAQSYIIAIDRKQGDALAKFNPKSLTVDVGDPVYWRNGDNIPHWPAPSVNEKSAWMDYQIPGRLPNHDAPVSHQPAESGAPKIRNYVCALHPDEKGTIEWK